MIDVRDLARPQLLRQSKASRRGNPISVKREQTFDPAPLRELALYRVDLRVGTQVTCQEGRASAAIENAHRMILGELYGDLHTRLMQMKHLIFAEDDKRAVEMIDKIIDEIT